MELSKDELGLLLERACLLGDAARIGELARAGAPMGFLFNDPPGVRAVEERLMAPAIDAPAGRFINVEYAERLSPAALRALLEAGVSAQGVASEGQAPIQALTARLSWPQTRDPAMVEATIGRFEALADAGGSVERSEGAGQGPLIRAAIIDRLPGAPLTRCLLRLGADPNAPGWDGERALHAACKAGNAVSAAALIAGGADERIRDDKGRSAKDLALGKDGPLKSAFIAALEERDLKAQLPVAKEARSPRI